MPAKANQQSAAQLLADILDRPVESIPANASIHNFPAWDSLAHVMLMLALEDASGTPVDPAKIMMLFSLEAVDDYLTELP